MSLPLSRILCLFLAAAFLSSCAASKPRRIDPNAPQIKDVAISIWMGDISKIKGFTSEEQLAYKTKFREALLTRFPDIFRANGISVQQISLEQHQTNTAQPGSQIGNAKTSHLLILNAKQVRYSTKYGARADPVLAVEYEASLVDQINQRVVWQSPIVYLNIVPAQPLLKTQQMAAWILNDLHLDKFISLKNGYAIDLNGEKIDGYWVWTPDR